MSKGKGYKYLFGPVPSRRLGKSLGINLVPKKICSYNCVYCEVGSSASTINQRKEYVSLEKLQNEIEEFLSSSVQIDVITLTGAGEPTLNSCIGDLIEAIKKITEIPVAVLTNGSLLFLDEVKKSLLNADIVIPSVDSVDEKEFSEVDRADEQVDLYEVLSGIKNFSYLYKGRLWLEVLIVKSLNDSIKGINKLGKWASTVKAERLQLGTVVRPPACDVSPISSKKLQKIKQILESFLSYPVEIVGEFKEEYGSNEISREAILASCNMRSLTKDDMIDIYGRSDDLDKMIFELVKEGKLKEKRFDNKRFFVATE